MWHNDESFYSLLAKQVKYFKETEGGRKDMCKAVEEVAECIGLPVNVVEELVELKWFYVIK